MCLDVFYCCFNEFDERLNGIILYNSFLAKHLYLIILLTSYIYSYLDSEDSSDWVFA